ncbi:MAG: hypothetical protein Kow00127_14700 [Bacteroidales bacterium]
MKSAQIKFFGITSLVILIGVLLTVGFNRYRAEQEAKLKSELERGDLLALRLHQRDSLVNDYLSALNRIEMDLATIRENEQLLEDGSDDPEMKTDKRTRILSTIQSIQDLISRNKSEIAQLQKKIRKSGLEIKGLNEKLELLAQSVADRDAKIETLMAELKVKEEELADLNNQLVAANQTIGEKEKIIEQKTGELNRGYVAYGDFKTLKERGIVSRTGNFLKTAKKLNDDFAVENFEPVDITQTRMIPVHAKKARLITVHPTGSYEWEQQDEMIANLIINDPQKFWQASKFAVVETK